MYFKNEFLIDEFLNKNAPDFNLNQINQIKKEILSALENDLETEKENITFDEYKRINSFLSLYQEMQILSECMRYKKRNMR
mgnify:CR=1 FL=1